MLLGMKLWAVGHLFANGDLRSMILFLNFLIYSVNAVVMASRRGKIKEHKPVSIIYDIGVLIVSLVGYSAFMHFYGDLLWDAGYVVFCWKLISAIASIVAGSLAQCAFSADHFLIKFRFKSEFFISCWIKINGYRSPI
ncbi:hypothetical protein BGP75_16530 [Motiliproteus sp. MSK22-1]|nr:hypothetical protein BGP75_16530 [Motiliproteus sp. MSK22-1]